MDLQRWRLKTCNAEKDLHARQGGLQHRQLACNAGGGPATQAAEGPAKQAAEKHLHAMQESLQRRRRSCNAGS